MRFPRGVAVATQNSPYIHIYNQDGDVLTKLPDPDVLPTGTGQRVSFTPDGRYLAISHYVTPYLSVYKRDGDSFTKLANPVTLPTGTGRGVSVSPDGQHIAIGHYTSPYISIYRRDGDTLTKLADPDVIPSSTGHSAVYSPDGAYLALGHEGSPYITVYKRNGDRYSKLPDLTPIPANYTAGVWFSHKSVYLGVGSAGSPYFQLYKRDGDTFTQIADPDVLPTSTPWGIHFSSDATYLAISSSTSPYLYLYKRDGDAFSKLSDPTVLPPATGFEVQFSSDDRYLSVAHSGSPYLTIYRRDGDTFTKIPDPAVTPGSLAYGATFTTPVWAKPPLKLHFGRVQQFDEHDVIGIAQGGTGAETSEQARDLLEVASKDHIHDDQYYTESEVDASLATKLDDADNEITDAHLGNRTVSDTDAPTGDSGLLATLLGWITNRIKSITGKASWRDAPSVTLETTNTHINSIANPHTVTKAQVGLGNVVDALQWHAGNDGAGSGLDADLLDGKDSSEFLHLSVEHAASVGVGWVTIATAATARAFGDFLVYDTDSSKHNFARINAISSFGQNTVVVLVGDYYNTRTIAHARILYNTSDRVYGGAKLQVYIESTCTLRLKLLLDLVPGWDSWEPITPVLEDTPSGWAEDITSRANNITNDGLSAYSLRASTVIAGTLNASDLVTLTQASGALEIASSTPQINFVETDITGAGSRYWFHHNSGTFYLLQDRSGNGAWDSPHPWYCNSAGNIVFGFTPNVGSNAIYHRGSPANLQNNGWTDGLRLQTPSGYIDFGPANASYAHIYTDRAQFYLNKDILINGSKVWHQGNDGAGSGLDADLLDGLQWTDFSRHYGRDTNDLNGKRTSGAYGLGSGNANSNVSYTSLIVAANSDTGLQIQGGYNSDNLWFRGWWSSGGGFSSWHKVWHNNNDGAGSGLDADMVDGYHTQPNASSANTVAVRNSAGDIHARLLRTAYPADSGITGNYILTQNAAGSDGADNYARPTGRAWMGSNGTWVAQGGLKTGTASISVNINAGSIYYVTLNNYSFFPNISTSYLVKVGGYGGGGTSPDMGRFGLHNTHSGALAADVNYRYVML